jgi:hypothetical protein
MNIKEYVKDIEDSLSNLSKRPFDAYILGPFLIWYGLKSKGMNKFPRKMLVAAGIWQLYYNWHHYRSLPENIKEAPQHLLTIVSNAQVMNE